MINSSMHWLRSLWSETIWYTGHEAVLRSLNAILIRFSGSSSGSFSSRLLPACLSNTTASTSSTAGPMFLQQGASSSRSTESTQPHLRPNQQQQQQQQQQEHFRHAWWQQQQQLPTIASAARTNFSSSSSTVAGQQLLLVRFASSSGPTARVRVVKKAGITRAAADELTAALQQLGLPAAAVKAITTVAPSWPSLSKDAAEIIERVKHLQRLMGAAAAAAGMLTTHPHLLTRPPVALQQQLVNLAAWLRLPIADISSSSSSDVLPGCQDLMDLVRSSPGVMFLPKQQVTYQLKMIEQLLHLPSLPPLLEEEITEFEKLLTDAQQQQQQSVSAAAAAAEDAEQQSFIDDIHDELQQLQQQQHAQLQQVRNALAAWQRQQQQQHQPPAAAAAAAAAATPLYENWAGRLMCGAPDWLFIEPQVTMPRRIDYIARLLFGSSITKPLTVTSSSSSSSSSSVVRQVAALLLDAPQLIAVHPSQVPAKVTTLCNIIKQHPAHNLLQQQQQQAFDAAAFLLQNPNLLIPSAKHLERNGAALLQRLPHLPLYQMLLLLPLPQLHWQQLAFLQHMQLLPAAAAAVNASTQQQQQLTADQLGLVTDALSLQPSEFTVKFPMFPAWQAAAAAVEQAVKGWQSGWGWATEFRQDLSGPNWQDWLQSMQGNWQRLLLLSAGQQWIAAAPTAAAATAAAACTASRQQATDQSASAAAAAAMVTPLLSGGSSRRSKRRTAAAAVPAAAGLSLKQLAQLPGQSFPYRPTADLGPLPFDLPDLQIQELLIRSRSRSGLGQSLAAMSKVWQQLVATADLSVVWRQQLENAAVLLPQALVAAGWKLQPDLLPALNSSSSSGGNGASSSSSSSWIDVSMDSRTPGSQAAAAAVARHQFWQHIQQPGVLDQLCSRLQYLHQVGLSADSEQNPSYPAATATPSTDGKAINPSDVWAVLTASEAGFSASYPTYATWRDLRNLVQGKPTWHEELAAYSGQQLQQFLQDAAAAWHRLSFLALDPVHDDPGSSRGSSSGLWQGMSMTDAVTVSDESFLELFPEARYSSWQALAVLRNGSSSAAAAAAAETLDTAAAAAERSASKKRTASSRNKPNANVAAQRLRLLQDYAALHQAWEKEIRAWKPENWSTVASTFVPLKARRVEFVLQFADPGGTDGSSSSTAAAVQVPDLLSIATSANKYFLKKFPMFTTWYDVTTAVQIVPQWSAQWQALKGSTLQSVLRNIESLTVPEPIVLQQQVFEQRLAELQRKYAELQQQQQQGGSSSDEMVESIIGRSALHRQQANGIKIGVTSAPSSSSSSSNTDTANADPLVLDKQAVARRNRQVVSRQRQQQQRRQLSGADVALHRLAYISKLRSNPAKDLPLTDILTKPQLDLLETLPGLDPILVAAKTQGLAAAESRFMEEVYPWLGLKALNPSTVEGLSPAGRQVLDERPGDLLLLQQFAHTWPEWERQLQSASAAALDDMLKNLGRRSERLQVIVRAGLQKYNAIRSILRMDGPHWRARYPIAQQLSELQSAASGVPSWERFLSQTPSGAKLVRSIDKLHKRRGRLAWLQEEGFTELGVMQVLGYTEERFREMFPEYTGDAEMHELLGSEVVSSTSMDGDEQQQ